MKRIININSLTLLVGIVAAAIAFWTGWASLSSQSLQVRVASQVALQPNGSGAINGLQVAIDGVPLKEPYLSVLEISNDGDKPIIAVDFEAPLEIRVEEGSILAKVQVTESKPKDIEGALSWEGQAIKIQPLLLNPGDALTISLLTSGKKPAFSTRARIAGISAVRIDDKADKPSYFGKTGVFLLIAFLLAMTSTTASLSLISKTPIYLRRRAAILILSSTGAVALGFLTVFLDAVGITNILSVGASVFFLFFISMIISDYWNRSDSTLPIIAEPVKKID